MTLKQNMQKLRAAFRKFLQVISYETGIARLLRRLEHRSDRPQHDRLKLEQVDAVRNLALLIVVCWRISGSSHTLGSRIVVGYWGVSPLDKALMNTCEKGRFPAWARDQLHFVDTARGLRRVELPAILSWANSAWLTAACGPGLNTIEIQISHRGARYLLPQLDITEDEAILWGLMLRREVAEVIDAQEPSVYPIDFKTMGH